jgi:hypothetical protein
VPGPSTKKQRGDVDDVGGGWFADEEKRQEGRRQGGGEYLSSLAGLGDHVRLGPHKIAQKNKMKIKIKREEKKKLHLLCITCLKKEYVGWWYIDVVLFDGSQCHKVSGIYTPNLRNDC